MACIETNYTISSLFVIDNMLRVNFQEGGHDEDITNMDTTILVPSCPKVNQLYIKIKFDTFE
jgi:hypothetical protein